MAAEEGLFSCGICQKTLVTVDLLKEHMKLHGSRLQYPCSVCGERLTSEYILTEHMKVHEKTRSSSVCAKPCLSQDGVKLILKGLSVKKKTTCGVYPCSVCGEHLTSEYIFTEHMKVHEKTRSSSVCAKPRLSQDGVKLILKGPAVTAVKKKTTCGVCKKSMNSKYLSTHMKEFHSSDGKVPRVEKIFTCTVCKKSIKSSNLKKHMRIHAVDEWLPCSICEKRFSLKAHLKRHMYHHTGEKPFVCYVCQKGFVMEVEMNIHIKTVHIGEKPFSCSVCEKKFAQKHKLTDHMMLHTGERPFPCSICNKSFIAKYDLKVHIKSIHMGEKPFSCSVCEKKFAEKRKLTNHMILHTGEKSFSCNICNKSFAKYDLKVHMKCHTNAQFSCSVCGKTFVQKKQIDNHMRMHTGEKQYKCTFSACKKAFNARRSLGMHIRTHTDEKTYTCSVCGLKIFAIEQSLINHLNTHNKNFDKQYLCSVCGKQFVDLCSLRRHERSHK